jgi:hypothetical protein
MNTHEKIPAIIRSNNPGRLRTAGHPFVTVPLVNGYRRFSDTHTGCEAMFYHIWHVYTFPGARTLTEFASLYEPQPDWDVNVFIKDLGKLLGVPPSMAASQDLFLYRPWKAVDIARAIIRCLNGPAPQGSPYHGEWVSPYDLCNALACVNHWTYP